MLLMDDMLIFFLLRILVVLITWISGFQYSKDTSKKFFDNSNLANLVK